MEERWVIFVANRWLVDDLKLDDTEMVFQLGNWEGNVDLIGVGLWPPCTVHAHPRGRPVQLDPREDRDH